MMDEQNVCKRVYVCMCMCAKGKPKSVCKQNKCKRVVCVCVKCEMLERQTKRNNMMYNMSKEWEWMECFVDRDD